jgi:hypothetical protein
MRIIVASICLEILKILIKSYSFIPCNRGYFDENIIARAKKKHLLLRYEYFCKQISILFFLIISLVLVRKACLNLKPGGRFMLSCVTFEGSRTPELNHEERLKMEIKTNYN